MTSYAKGFFFKIIIFTTLIIGVSCINCYYCNSANNSACLDINQFEDEVRARVVPVVDCSVSSPTQFDFFCRKITQTIYHPHREAEVRVTRGCGWVRHEKECYRADNSDHLETVCQCFSDHCNSADSADPASTVMLFLILATVLYLYR